MPIPSVIYIPVQSPETAVFDWKLASEREETSTRHIQRRWSSDVSDIAYERSPMNSSPPSIPRRSLDPKSASEGIIRRQEEKGPIAPPKLPMKSMYVGDCQTWQYWTKQEREISKIRKPNQ